jgi:DNA polymerase III subunit delta
MTQRELEELVKKQKPLPNSIMLYGQSRYLSSYYSQIIAATFQDGCDVLKLYFDEYDFATAKNFLSQSSLFGDKLALVVKHDKKIPKNDLKELIPLAAKNDSIFLFELFVDLSNAEKDYVSMFDAKNSGASVRFFQPTHHTELLGLARNEAISAGVELDNELLMQILHSLNFDMELVANEIKKLSSVSTHIDDSAIRSLVLHNDNLSCDKFLELILNKKEFARELEPLMEQQGIDEIRIVLDMQRLIYDLFICKCVIRIKHTLDPMMAFGRPNIPREVLAAKENLVKKLSDKTLSKILDTLLQTDLDLKSSINSDKRLVLLHSLIKIQSFLR